MHPVIIPTTRDAGIIHKTEVLNNPKKAIEIAVKIETIPAINVPLAVAKGTKSAIKNKRNKGATNKFTTFIMTSIKFPCTLLTKILSTMAKHPVIKDIFFTSLSESI